MQFNNCCLNTFLLVIKLLIFHCDMACHTLCLTYSSQQKFLYGNTTTKDKRWGIAYTAQQKSLTRAHCTTKVLVHSDPSSSSVNQSAKIVDCKGHDRRACHKSYALWLATCYNKRWVRAHTTLVTNVWPIQFSNRPDVCWVGLDNNIQTF